MTEKPGFINWDLIIEELIQKNRSKYQFRPPTKEEKEARLVIGDRQRELQEQLDAMNQSWHRWEGYES